MFVLNSNITIGQFKKVSPHEVKITKSVQEYVDKAVIKLPATGRLKRSGEVLSVSADIAKQFIEGDFVEIDLGYNGKLVNEFTGFVSKINFATPIEVECEGYSYVLRKKRFLKKFKNTKLIDILKFLIVGTEITLNKKHVADLPITNIVFDNNSGTECLEIIKKQLGNLIQIYFKNSVLHAELFPVVPFLNTAFYKLGWNVIKDESLKLKEPKNENFVVKFQHTSVEGNKSTGEHLIKKVTSSASASTGGEVINVKSAINDDEANKKLAESYAIKKSYRGYEGKIKAFLQPYCETAWRANITDEKYPERSGIYLVESIEVTYGMAGARRTVGIGIKL